MESIARRLHMVHQQGLCDRRTHDHKCPWAAILPGWPDIQLRWKRCVTMIELVKQEASKKESILDEGVPKQKGDCNNLKALLSISYWEKWICTVREYLCIVFENYFRYEKERKLCFNLYILFSLHYFLEVKTHLHINQHLLSLKSHMYMWFIESSIGACIERSCFWRREHTTCKVTLWWGGTISTPCSSFLSIGQRTW